MMGQPDSLLEFGFSPTLTAQFVLNFINLRALYSPIKKFTKSFCIFDK